MKQSFEKRKVKCAVTVIRVTLHYHCQAMGCSTEKKKILVGKFNSSSK